MDCQVFISTNDLQTLIDSDSVQVVDSGMNTKEQHFQSRIPGSKYFSIGEIRKSLSQHSQEIPTLDEFTEYMKRLGLKNDGRHVVVYDQSGFALSGRAWFVLSYFGYRSVRILDGGLVKWLAEGRKTESGEYDIMGNTVWRDEDYQFAETQNVRILHEEVKEVVAKCANNESGCKVWDPRPAEMFANGHVDHAINIPVGSLFNPDKTVKSKEEVAGILHQRFGNELVITSCMKGNIACLGFALLKYAGRDCSKVYTGSYEEWNSLRTQ